MSPAAQKLQTLDREAAIKEPLSCVPDVKRLISLGRESPETCNSWAALYPETLASCCIVSALKSETR
jgi:hypothetical protein